MKENLSPFEYGLLAEAFFREDGGVLVTEAESNVTILGNSGISRNELVKKGILKKVKVKDSLWQVYKVTEKGKGLLFEKLGNQNFLYFQNKHGKRILGEKDEKVN